MVIEGGQVVTIKFLGRAADIVGTKEVSREVNAPTPLRDLLEVDSAELDQFLVLVNQQASSLDSLVSDQDEIIIMPMIGGG